MGDLANKLEAFGFSVQCVDGHDVGALKDALMRKSEGKPAAVLAKTVRGYGSKTLMGDRSWFHRWPKADELQVLCGEVDAF